MCIGMADDGVGNEGARLIVRSAEGGTLTMDWRGARGARGARGGIWVSRGADGRAGGSRRSRGGDSDAVSLSDMVMDSDGLAGGVPVTRPITSGIMVSGAGICFIFSCLA